MLPAPPHFHNVYIIGVIASFSTEVYFKTLGSLEITVKIMTVSRFMEIPPYFLDLAARFSFCFRK